MEVSMTISITEASAFIAELIDVLENLYWEAHSVAVKNQCFNGVRFLQNERTELTKVSVQDHHYEYEIISCSAKDMKHCFESLSKLIEHEVLRAQTRSQLMPLLEKAKTHFPSR
jgi:isopropylmalate/homocitrate/citramalate synthase